MNEYAPTGTSLTHTVADWLMSQALTGGQGVDRIVEGCCARLSAAGIPIWGANISFRTLHPLFRAMSVTWMRDAGVASTGFGHQGEERENRRLSPINRLITTRVPVLRRRLAGPEALYDFPILDELRDKGATDYLAFVVPFNEDWSDGIGGSWATDRASGFSDGDIRELLRIQQRLAVACKVKIKDEIARNIVDAYLGHKAGSRVIAGRIKRGDAETIHAAIWYSDLRNSTGFAESLPPARYLSLLDDYFQCTAGAVMGEGGEVLLLLGDAVLSIFPIDEAEPAAACEAAMRAAAEAERRLAGVNHARTDGLTLDFGIGLHVGDLTFGNIGVPARLQFTVVGPAANAVSRIHDLGKALAQPVTVSAAFAAQLALDWQSLGEHELRGLAGRHLVFAPPAAAQRTAG